VGDVVNDEATENDEARIQRLWLVPQIVEQARLCIWHGVKPLVRKLSATCPREQQQEPLSVLTDRTGIAERPRDKGLGGRSGRIRSPLLYPVELRALVPEFTAMF
jgi:hypothetical protein